MNPEDKSKQLHILEVIGGVIILVLLGYWFWAYKKPAPAPAEPAVNVNQILDSVTNTSVTPKIESNPVQDKLPELNPVEKTNPFKYKNPFQ